MRKTLPLLAGLIIASSALNAQQDTLRVLFVGNSYTYGYNLPHIVSILSEGTATKLVTRKSVAGGARLREHWNGDRDLDTRRLISDGDFDVVVLQDFSMSAINSPDSTLKYVRLFSDYIKGFGAKTCLFNTWARERVPQYQDEIDEMCRTAALENGALRVPVGPAWQLAMDLRPGIDLFTSDGSHPNELGTLLTASVFVRILSGGLPEPMTTLFRIEDAEGETVRLMNHHPEDAEFCRRIANQVVSQ